MKKLFLIAVILFSFVALATVGKALPERESVWDVLAKLAKGEMSVSAQDGSESGKVSIKSFKLRGTENFRGYNLNEYKVLVISGLEADLYKNFRGLRQACNFYYPVDFEDISVNLQREGGKNLRLNAPLVRMPNAETIEFPQGGFLQVGNSKFSIKKGIVNYASKKIVLTLQDGKKLILDCRSL